MENNILFSMPALHAIILSIVVALSAILLLYAHQTMLECQSKLMDYRRQVSTVMTLNFSSSRGLDQYMKDGKPNMEAIYKGLVHAVSFYQYLDLENRVGIKYKEPVYSPDKIIDSACNFLTVISILSHSHPYDGKTNYRDHTGDISIVYDKEWLKYLKKN